MTETPPEAVVEVDDTGKRFAVYDEAELRFVDDGPVVKRADATKRASELNDGNDVARADGKRGKRYSVREV